MGGALICVYRFDHCYCLVFCFSYLVDCVSVTCVKGRPLSVFVLCLVHDVYMRTLPSELFVSGQIINELQ